MQEERILWGLFWLFMMIAWLEYFYFRDPFGAVTGGLCAYASIMAWCIVRTIKNYCK